MKKGYLAFAALSLFALKANAQQDPHYTQYMYNMNVMNPAYAGSKENLSWMMRSALWPCMGMLARLESSWLDFFCGATRPRPPITLSLIQSAT